MNLSDSKKKLALAGVVCGLVAACLAYFGNPANMGFCIACFLRDITGALGMHGADKVQYVRPEIVGLVLGAFIMAVATREFRAKAGSSPALRFVLGGFVMIGALAFLGCPLRMVLRLAGGDGNALVGLVGFAIGIFVGTLFMKRGFSLKRAYDVGASEGAVLPVLLAGLLILFLAVPTLFRLSEAGPGSMHAPVLLAFLVALVIGALAQRSRLCMAGGIRDAMMLKDFHLLMGFVAIFVAVLVGNLIVGGMGLRGGFNPGFAGQAVAHTDGLWNLLGMVLVGLGSVLLGGCPLRQLILSGSGNSDSSVAVLGMVVGAAFCHNFGLASSTDGPSFAGKVAVIIGLVLVCAIGAGNTKKA